MDGRAQMPFSIVAVLLLVLSSASIALVYGLDAQKDRARIPQGTLEDMVRTMSSDSEEVVRMAYSAAAEAVMGVSSLNRTQLQERFDASLNASVEEAFVDDEEMWTTVIPRLSLVYLWASMDDPAVLRGEQTSSEDSRSVPAYAAIVGNFTVEVHCPQGMITRTIDLEQDVYVPLPLLSYRLDRMSNALDPRGELESIVRYELTALAQDRVLRGYGSYAKTGSISTENIITSEDVVRAVELALLLEELMYFHDVNATSSKFPGSSDPLQLDGYVDPADLFLRSYGDGGIDVTTLVAQSLYARADAIVLRWMEYLGVVEIADHAEDLYEAVEGGLWSAVDLLTGGDRDQASMTDYISQAMTDAGIIEANYRWYNYGGADILVTLPSYRICLFNDADQEVYRTFQGTYSIDLPSMDLFASEEWGNLYETYRSQTHALADGMRGYIEAIAQSIAAHCSLPNLDLALDPSDVDSYIDEIDRQLEKAFQDRSSWLSPALNKLNEVGKVRDGLAQAVLDFIHGHWTELMRMNWTTYVAGQQLSATLVADLQGLPGWSAASIARAQSTIEMFLLGDNWGAREVIEQAVGERAAPVQDMLEVGLSQRYSEVDPLLRPLATGLTVLPGVGTLTSLSVLDTVDDMAQGLAAQGGEVRVPVSSSSLRLTLADGQERTESINVERSVLTSSTGRASTLDVEITYPWEYALNTTYPNRHVTDVMNMSSSPYLTQWSIGYEGNVELTVRSGATGDLATSLTIEVPLCSTFNVVTFSGWGLKGVTYEPTATLIGDIQKLLVKVWSILETAAGVVGGAMGNVYRILNDIAGGLLSLTVQGLESLNDVLTAVVKGLMSTAGGLLDDAVGLLVDSFVGIWKGTVIDLSVLGLDLSLRVAPQDSALAGVTDLLRIDVKQSLLGVTLISSLRVLKLANGDHALAAAATLGEGEWKVSVTIDPLQKVYTHQVEMRGYLGGNVLEIFFPEVERTEKVSLALSDVPGMKQLLQSIPSPVPGTKFHIDAVMELSFNVAQKDGVMINEIELNPQGTDRSREWVELFNPTDKDVNLDGWTLVTSHGDSRAERLSGTLAAHGRMVHQFTGQALDNGEVEGFPLQESVALLNKNGERVDSAPWLQDLKDDGRTWQRSYDGASSWEFRDGSKGKTNGDVLTMNSGVEDVAAMMVDCFQDSLGKNLASGMDVTAIKAVVAGALYDLEDRMLDSLEMAISSLRFSVELGLDDASGTVGGGMFAAVVYDGKAVRACVEWFVDMLGEVLRDPLNPRSAGVRAVVPAETLAEHVFVEGGAYLQASAPDLMEGPVNAKLTVKAVVQFNLGTLVPVYEGCDKVVNFGLVVGVPGLSLKSHLGLAAEDRFDVWLLKGVLRPA